MLGWKAKSNWARVFTAGSRDERMAACRRRLLRSPIWASSSSSMASASGCAAVRLGEDAVDGFQGAGHLEVGEHLPQPIAPVACLGPHDTASA